MGCFPKFRWVCTLSLAPSQLNPYQILMLSQWFSVRQKCMCTQLHDLGQSLIRTPQMPKVYAILYRLVTSHIMCYRGSCEGPFGGVLCE